MIAYNRFARDIDRIAIQQETFIEEFSNILQRNVGAPPRLRRPAATATAASSIRAERRDARRRRRAGRRRTI